MNAIQCKMARTAISLGVRDLARAAGVSPNTIARLERGEDLKSGTVEAIKNTLEAYGIEFIPKNGGNEGVRLAREVAVQDLHDWIIYAQVISNKTRYVARRLEADGAYALPDTVSPIFAEQLEAQEWIENNEKDI